MSDIVLAESMRLLALPSVLQAMRDVVSEIDRLSQPESASKAAASIIRIRHCRQQMQHLMDAIDKLDTNFCQAILPAIYEKDDETKSITSLGYRVTTTEAIKARMLDKVAAFTWLEKAGHGDIIDREPRVNAQTLNAFCKDLLIDGDVPPDDIISVFQFTNASITKANSK